MQLRMLFLFLISISFNLRALTVLRPGDIILQPLNCWTCSLIEAEEGSIYSHMGLVIKADTEIVVAESFGQVRALSLKDFLSKTEKHQAIKILRFKEDRIVDAYTKNKDRYFGLFLEEYNGRTYDSEFRWNNMDEHGNEKLYCSEFVTKFLMATIGYQFPTKSMHYLKYRKEWLRYFNGSLPEREIGNSPADFEKSDDFVEVQ
ncbi:MAG: hypothetical protein K2P81_11540 [Bacteriovoracaceae bacterium]|nr:hypothetical protein [Bacteriovoracaceae bacterium]